MAELSTHGREAEAALIGAILRKPVLFQDVVDTVFCFMSFISCANYILFTYNCKAAK